MPRLKDSLSRLKGATPIKLGAEPVKKGAEPIKLGTVAIKNRAVEEHRDLLLEKTVELGFFWN